jgi:hypothetical protein
MTQAEVNDTIDRLFKIQKELKNKIISNIDSWYNGYFDKYGSKLYQIYSTTRYLEDCFKEYKKKGISMNETDNKWIPSPMPYSVSSEEDDFCNDCLRKGFSGECYDSFLSLCRGDSVSFSRLSLVNYPLLKSLEESPCTGKDIIFPLLMHCGYLTR